MDFRLSLMLRDFKAELRRRFKTSNKQREYMPDRNEIDIAKRQLREARESDNSANYFVVCFDLDGQPIPDFVGFSTGSKTLDFVIQDPASIRRPSIFDHDDSLCDSDYWQFQIETKS